MLRHIHIRHFAIVEQLTLDLTPGMTALTGETGAGKSILLDALGLALGDRAETGIIRAGAERAEISAEFDIRDNTAVQAWLREHELDDDEQCLIRRTVGKDGRSKGYINGRPVPMQSLRELGEQLVDIHGQHAHQSLLKRDIQRQALDAYAGNEKASHHQLLADTITRFQHWQKLSEELTRLQTSREVRDNRLELLRYQVEELRELGLGADELEQLETEHARLANLNHLQEGGEQVLGTLNVGDGAIADALEHISSELARLRDIDPALGNACETLQSAAIQARETGTELRVYLDSLSLDPERLHGLDERLGLIHDLARKHRLPPAELPALQTQLETELAELEQAGEQLADIAEAVVRSERVYRDIAAKLGTRRQRAAKNFAKAVTENLHQLGMPHGRFEIALEPLETPSPAGLERVEYHVTTNPGQPFQPLTKVASGGELARISLAIQVITASSGAIPSLIFDEVDVGIGGGIAEVVGRLLRNLSDARQVLCVTHQPQVASLAHHHLQVRKHSGKKTTITEIAPLGIEERVDEIARMLGGLEITRQTLSHAREMIERGQQSLS
jgi:DNA repair protein RecN (Recombination protein N)